MNRDPQLISRILKYDLMQFSSMPIEHRRCRITRWRLLMRHHLPSIIFMDLKAIITQIDRHSAHLGSDIAIAPAVEDAAGVRAEGDDVPEDLELGEGFVDLDVVPLAVTFYCCCEASKSCVRVSIESSLGRGKS